jgi:broad specificity phosphatase PhoE
MPSDAPPVVLLARHGETEWNRVGRMQGQTDVPLSAKGLDQARRLAARIASLPPAERPARIVSSDLKRALETAEAVGVRIGVPVVADPRFREDHMGSWQGLTRAEAIARDPDAVRHLVHRKPDARPPGPGGETRAELSSRSWKAFLDAAAPGTPGPLLIVAHGGVIMSILYRVLGLAIDAPRRFQLPNVGLSTLVCKDSTWFVRCLNDTSHVPASDVDSFPFG